MIIFNMVDFLTVFQVLAEDKKRNLEKIKLNYQNKNHE
jgi:hypothetical protein